MRHLPFTSFPSANSPGCLLFGYESDTSWDVYRRDLPTCERLKQLGDDRPVVILTQSVLVQAFESVVK